MWTEGLRQWFEGSGRHHLPWRQTTDPWAVLVSEVMLQQTSVARVLPRWPRFLELWPTAQACAAAPLTEVLRVWQGLGYPRRARALWLCADQVATDGWPSTEAGLRALPGVGTYTARALLALSDVGVDPLTPPRDINLSRVAARAAMGIEPHTSTAACLDSQLREARPQGMTMREYTYALFDVGALHCRARPLCAQCPLRDGCAARALRPEADSLAATVPPPRRQAPYAGSLRQLRGALLKSALELDIRDPRALAAALGDALDTEPARVTLALQGLIDDGLLPAAESPCAQENARG